MSSGSTRDLRAAFFRAAYGPLSARGPIVAKLSLSVHKAVSKSNPKTGNGAPMIMNVVETADGMTHVELDGRFDIAGAQEVDSRVVALADKSSALVVDLSKVSFIASLGVRTLMVSAKALIRRSADMAVCGANEGVEKVLRSTGFDELVGLYPDFDSAAKAIKGRAAAFAANREA
jgi:anti-anti-sigma factor